MMTPTCPYCDIYMEYVGVNDGGGDYGSAVCDYYECEQCNHVEERDCIEFEDDSEDGQD